MSVTLAAVGAPEQAVEACKCMADKEADIVAAADLAYIEAYKTASESLQQRMRAIALNCAVAARLRAN